MHESCHILHEIAITPGTPADYARLEPFHYRAGPPRGVTRVFAARHPELPHHLAGLIVETLPPLAGVMRRLALPGRYDGLDLHLGAALLNRELRTIARVVVHPLFRGIGLGERLVRHLLDRAHTPLVEAFAAMGHVHPLFQRAGMHAYLRPPGPDEIRLRAALQRERIAPADLFALPPDSVNPFLARELRRFARRKTAGVDAWLDEARRRLGVSPVYYLWNAPASAPAGPQQGENHAKTTAKITPPHPRD